MKKTICQFLQEHAAKNAVSFHMPGHKGAAFYREVGYGTFLETMMDWDITEIPGADNLFQSESIIQETMNRYKTIYGVKDSYLLINGSSAGLIGSVLAAVPRGGKLIMARNSHKSIFNALSLGDIEPVYAYPQLIEDYAVTGPVLPDEIEKCLKANPDAAAVILPSPNYYGICSDIRSIAEVVHGYGKLLIVDQAHGAHLKFFGKWVENINSQAAEDQGADVVVNSIHKTLGSFTQTAIVNLCTDAVDENDLEDKLQVLESSSPSYLLMASLDINADLLERHGRQRIKQWNADLDWFYAAAEEIPGLKVMQHPQLDRSKLNLDMAALGIDGEYLEEKLMERNIFVELVTGNLVMCMTGIGNRRCDYERLIEALAEIGKEAMPSAKKEETGRCVSCFYPAAGPLHQEMMPAEKEWIPLTRAVGRVCAASLIPYPPGIPLVCPGEVFDTERIEYISQLRRTGYKVIGINRENLVLVGKK